MKAPSFQLYAGDFLVGTAMMSAEEVGAYIRLLCYQWTEGSLPNDDAVLARLAGCGGNAVASIRNKFGIDSAGRLANARLEQVRAEQVAYRKQQSENALHGWEKRRKDRVGNAIAMPSHMPNGCSPSSSSTSSSTTNPIPPVSPPRGAGEAGEAEKPKPGNQAKTETQRRAEKLFRRRDSTPWGTAELKAWKTNRAAIEATTDAEWAALEAFYAFRETDHEVVYRRRDFATLLNNWTGEVDKARAFQANGPSLRQGAPYVANRAQARAEEALMPPVFDMDGNPAEF